MTPDLVQALEEGATVITPNRRLALYLKSDYDSAQTQSGKSVWPGADALPYGAFLERTWQELALADNGALLLSQLQEIALWETVIEASRLSGLLLNLSATARAVREAWIMQHAYCMDHRCHPTAWSLVNDDVSAFSGWSSEYAERLRREAWVDSAQLPERIAQALKNGSQLRVRSNATVARIVLAGFDGYTPQQQQLFDAFTKTGSRIEDVPTAIAPSNTVRYTCDDGEAELMFVAEQVRTLLTTHVQTKPSLRIGVVVPDLAARRIAVWRIFDDALDPLRAATPGDSATRLFNCSLGLPLLSYPIVFSAFLILKLARGETTLVEAGALLRSPYLGAADSELAARAQMDAQLRARGRKRVTSGVLLQTAQADRSTPAPKLAALLESWLAGARDARRLRQPPSVWSATFLALLKGLGWPGERTLDSNEFQTFEKFREVISGLSALDAMRPRLTLDEALNVLRRLTADTVFQPETTAAPVQILGTLESIGLSFDTLFVVGLAGESWPAAPRPNPFLPVTLQRALGVPHASAEWELGFARRMTRVWRNAAPEVVLTWPRRDGERDLSMSPLIDDVSEGIDTVIPRAQLHDVLFAARRLETLNDSRAPPLNEGARVKGGTQMFQNQAACPFRAYAIHRLGATTLEEGSDGLDPRERGSLVHQAVSALWRELQSQTSLLAQDDAALEKKAKDAVDAAVDTLCRARPDLMTDAFAALERERLTALLLRLTTLEKDRAPFDVLACEQPRTPVIAGVHLSARLDRVDRLADGSHVILDYKTGVANIGSWLGERPDEPQLPLYAVSDDAVVSGVAFVQMRARDVAFKGLTRDEHALPHVATLATTKNKLLHAAHWPALLDSWRNVLEQLARNYLAGHAEVVPKNYPQTCEYCALGALCRVRELTDHAASVDADDDADESAVPLAP